MAKQPKLKALLEDIFNEQPQINKYEVSEGVKSFGIVGKSLYNNGNIMEIAKQVSHIAEQAHTHVMSETDDWFDQVSVNKNMQSLKKRVSEFQKTAQESHQLNQRLTGLYEDMGHILNRYYDISEADELVGETVNDPDGLAPDSPAGTGEEMKEALDADKTAAKDGRDFQNQYADEDGEAMKSESAQSDPHNVDGHNSTGGDEPSRDGEEMQEAIRQTRENMNKRPVRRLKDIGGVVGIPSLGQIARKLTGK
jgi:hypothetical protein